MWVTTFTKSFILLLLLFYHISTLMSIILKGKVRRGGWLTTLTKSFMCNTFCTSCKVVLPLVKNIEKMAKNGIQERNDKKGQCSLSSGSPLLQKLSLGPVLTTCLTLLFCKIVLPKVSIFDNMAKRRIEERGVWLTIMWVTAFTESLLLR